MTMRVLIPLKLHLKNCIEIVFQILPHPPYSPDLSPSDFYLFSPLKSCLIGKTFDSSEQLQNHLQQFIDTKSSKFFRDGIQKLPKRWKKCIDHEGDYFSHLKDDHFEL